ncbi:MAG: hypothetical protein Q9163_001115 [Psora crenata]
MSSQLCWCCLARRPGTVAASIHRRITLKATSLAPFSTTTSFRVNPPKKKAPLGKPQQLNRGAKQTFTKKKKKVERSDRSRRPAIGERKALRKRVVLSNTNALEVNGLQDISAEKMMDERSRGQVLGIPGEVVDQLRAVDAFKPAQGWGLYRRPAMLVRRETGEYARLMEGLGKGVVKRVLVGERGSGKTVMLLQAMAMAFLKGWVVINIPEAQDLVIGHTEYSPVNPNSLPTTYSQKSYTANLLTAITRANPILHKLQLSQGSPQPTTSPGITRLPSFPNNISLARLASLGATDPENAWAIFQILYRELIAPGRPPLLLCLDGLAHTMCNSKYRDADYNPIHAHQLSLIEWFLGHLSGEMKLPNGGMVLAATSESNNPLVPSLRLALTQLEGNQDVQKDPFKKYDERVLGVFDKGGVEVQRMGGVSREEARGVMEYWASSGVYRDGVTEEVVGREWAISGGGVVGELERACVRMKI